jgi:hypothetical protein
MDSIINSAMKRNHRVSVKVLKKNTTPMTYSDYTKRLQRFYDGLARDIADDLEACSYDFVEDRVVLSVIPPGGQEKLYDLFEYPSLLE